MCYLPLLYLYRLLHLCHLLSDLDQVWKCREHIVQSVFSFNFCLFVIIWMVIDFLVVSLLLINLIMSSCLWMNPWSILLFTTIVSSNFELFEGFFKEILFNFFVFYRNLFVETISSWLSFENIFRKMMGFFFHSICQFLR